MEDMEDRIAELERAGCGVEQAKLRQVALVRVDCVPFQALRPECHHQD
jgi:hypothetical protein